MTTATQLAPVLFCELCSNSAESQHRLCVSCGEMIVRLLTYAPVPVMVTVASTPAVTQDSQHGRIRGAITSLWREQMEMNRKPITADQF